MSTRILPTMLISDVTARKTTDSCYVTIGTKVYDVTHFLDSHPGGQQLILDYGGKDIEHVLKDESLHFHSRVAFEILEDTLVGFVALSKKKCNGSVPLLPATPRNEQSNDITSSLHVKTGMTSEEDLTKDTDPENDYKTHRFLDLNKPLFIQVLFGGFSKEFYLQQVHRPRHYKGGNSAPIFGNFLEPLTKTPWWIIPLVWGPAVAYGTFSSRIGCSSWTEVSAYWSLGLLVWTLIEYGLHRFLFHLDYYLPDNSIGLSAHFLLHGIHHYLPMDRYRLVMPPALFILLALPFWKLSHSLFFWNWHIATAVFCGGVFGYICYDLTHYFIHHSNLPSFYQNQKRYHLQHHFMDYENGFGISSSFWDRVFGTELVVPISKISKHIRKNL